MPVSRRRLLGGSAAAGVGALVGAGQAVGVGQAAGAALAEPLDRPFVPLTAPHLVQAELMVHYQRLLAAGYLPDGLAGHWPLAGDGSDHSGGGRVLTRGPGTAFTTLRAGGELSFDGRSGAWATTAATLDTTASFTVSAWVRLADAEPLSTMFTAVSQDSATVSRFLLQHDPDLGWAFKVRDAAGTVKVSAVARPEDTAVAGRWVHLTGVSDNGTLRLYVNGNPGAPVASTIGWAATRSLQIGHATWQGAVVNRWSGAISDVRVYQRALTDAEVWLIAGRKARENNQYVIGAAAELGWGLPADPSTWIARARCASFVSGVLNHTYPWATESYFRTWFHDPSPEAEDYRRYFADNPGPRMRRIDKVADLLPGDLIAIDYSTVEEGTPQANTGHIVMVRELKAPYAGGPATHPGVTQYPIEVLDCTAEAHGEYKFATYADFPDTRMVWEDGTAEGATANFEGVGIGHVFFYADAAGGFAGYRWSVNSGADHTYPVAVRPIAAVRIV